MIKAEYRKVPKWIIEFSVFLLWFAAAFDPIGEMGGLRYVALIFIYFALIAKILVGDLRLRLSRAYRALFILFVFIIPIYGAFVGVLRGGFRGHFIDTSYAAAAAYFFCSLIYFDERIEIDTFLKLARIVLRLLCLLIFFCLGTVLTGPSRVFIAFLFDHGLMFFGSRYYGSLALPYLYVITSPMLILLLSCDAWRFLNSPSIKRALLLASTMCALFLTGTRANQIASIFGVVLIAIWRKHKRYSILYLALIVSVFGLILYSIKNSNISEMFSAKDQSNAKKINYLISYSYIFSDPVTLIFGQGFNAHVWSEKLSEMVNYGEASKTELTYLEYFRVFGIVGFIATIGALAFLKDGLDRIPAQYQWIEPAFLIYCAVSAVNPYIFSSNGMLVFGLLGAIISIKKESSNIDRINGLSLSLV